MSVILHRGLPHANCHRRMLLMGPSASGGPTSGSPEASAKCGVGQREIRRGGSTGGPDCAERFPRCPRYRIPRYAHRPPDRSRRGARFYTIGSNLSRLAVHRPAQQRSAAGKLMCDETRHHAQPRQASGAGRRRQASSDTVRSASWPLPVHDAAHKKEAVGPPIRFDGPAANSVSVIGTAHVRPRVLGWCDGACPDGL